jgi:hypothetical protein
MKHSSRNDPCPICSRNTDDKCRWDSNFISCYYGDSFHPPNSLRVGDFAEAFGQRWRLVRQNGGFSGGSYIFALCKEEAPARYYTREERELYRKQVDFIAHKSRKTISLLRKQVHRCFGLPVLSSMNFEQICEARELLQSTLNDCENAIKFVTQNRRSIPDAKRLTTAFSIWAKLIKNQKKDVDHFAQHYLGVIE